MKWTEEEINIIKENYESMSDEELTTLLPNRNKCAIECKRKKLGLKRPQFKKYNFQDVINEFSKHKEYILLSNESEYKNCNSKMRYVCTKHREKGEQSISLNHLSSGRGCYYCGREVIENAHIKEFDKELDKKLCEEKGFQYMDTIRKNKKITIVFICNNHVELGIQYMTKSNMINNKKGCKYCSGKELPEWYVLKKAKEINPDIEILEPYINMTTSMNCYCKKHNYSTRKTMQQIFKGQGCYYCGCEKLSEQSYLSDEMVQSTISKINPHIKLIEYKGTVNKSKFYCLKHNKFFSKGYYAVAHNKNSGCDLCYLENIRNTQGMGIDKFKERLKEIHPELKVIGEYINYVTPIEIYCTTHNYTFYSKPVDLFSRITCCDKTRINYKEEQVCKTIEDTYGFSITRQKRFEDCKDKSTLPFDIYLDDYNILIEYQGEQHYRPVMFSSESLEEANKKFEYTKRHDFIKEQYCVDNNIPLIKIPYWEFENLDYFLFNEFVKLNIIKEITT